MTKFPQPVPAPGPDAATPAPETAFSHPLRTGALSSRKPTRFALMPDAAARAAVAAELGLLTLSHLIFKGELRPSGARDFVLEARLEATVEQPCGLTLAPVTTAVAEDVIRHYLFEWSDPTGDDVQMTGDDTTDPLPEVIDVAAVAVEALTLALPLYPRAPGVAWAPVSAAPEGVAPLQDDDLKPFAGLAALRGRLADDTPE